MTKKLNNSLKYCEYNKILLKRELFKQRINIQRKERNNRILRREMKTKIFIEMIIEKKKLLINILDLYKTFSEHLKESICKYNCNGICKQLCTPKILTDKEMISIVKMQLLTESPFRLHIKNKQYSQCIHMLLCFRIFIKWYYDRHPYLYDFCISFCSDNKLNYSSWENDEFFLCNEIKWDFSSFS
jgi:hypothetical protein